MKSFLTRFLYGGTSDLRDYESLCLNWFKERLPEEARLIIEAQVNAVNLIQRSSQDKLIVFHFLTKGADAHLSLFSNHSPELYVARLTITSAATSSGVRCDVVFHEGRISSLEFNQPPKLILKAPLNCEKVEILENLLQAPSAEQETPPLSGRAEILTKIRNRFDVSDVFPSVAAAEREKFLARLSSMVPDDYIELLQESNGFSVDGWQFYGTNARRIVMPSQNYWLLAEDENSDKALCVCENASSPIIFIYDQIGGELLEVGDVFIEAFIQQLSAR